MSDVNNYQLNLLESGAKTGVQTVTIIPGAQRRYKVLEVRVSLTTDATVANRNIRLRHIYTGGEHPGQTHQSPNVAASTTHVMTFGPQEVGTNAVLVDGSTVIWHQPLECTGTGAVIIDIVNGVAGDAWTATWLVKDEASGN